MSAIEDVDLRRVTTITAFFFCAAISWIVLSDYMVDAKFANDFSVYWRAANQSVGDVYFWPGRFPFPYAPTMLIWIQPLALLDKWPAYFLFSGLSVGVFVLVARRHIPPLAILLCLVSPPFLRGAFTGQVCALVAGLLIVACVTEKRVLAGIIFAVIASIKPHLVLLAPLMLLIDRDWRAFFSAAIAFFVIVIASVVLFGAARWPEWIASMDHFQHAVADTNVLGAGITPTMFAERNDLPKLPFMLFGAVAGIFVVWKARAAAPLERATAVAVGSLLAAPYALIYDLTVAMPLMALYVFRGRIVAVLAMADPIHSLPIVFTTAELLQDWVRKFGERRARESFELAPAVAA